MRLPLVIGAAVCVAILLFVMSDTREPSADSEATGASQQARGSPRSDRDPGARESAQVRSNARGQGDNETAGDDEEVNAVTYARLREQLADHLAQLAQEGAPGSDEVDDSSERELPSSAETRESPYSGGLDREYIQDAIREVLPLVGECYELMLDAQTRAQGADELAQGELDSEGRVVLDFVIGGEEEVGGVVIAPEVNQEQSANFGREFSTCVTETLMTLELPAPENGGQVRVTYPFNFRPEPQSE